MHSIQVDQCLRLYQSRNSGWPSHYNNVWCSSRLKTSFELNPVADGKQGTFLFLPCRIKICILIVFLVCFIFLYFIGQITLIFLMVNNNERALVLTNQLWSCMYNVADDNFRI